MTVIGPDFLALQVADVERAAAFYEHSLGLIRAEASPPGAVVFATEPAPFAVREPLPGFDPAVASPRPGAGVALWFAADGTQELHDRLVSGGVTILAPPVQGPFGLQFTFADPDGYAVTLHERV
jgi:predicted enzyme related to lactoylglutathione lyase